MFWGSGSGDWEDWLRKKGLLGGADGQKKEEGHSVNGWTDPNDDLSDLEVDDGSWSDGGMKRPGARSSEEYSSEEAMDDDWNDSDDDDHGGHMMPVPDY